MCFFFPTFGLALWSACWVGRMEKTEREVAKEGEALATIEIVYKSFGFWGVCKGKCRFLVEGCGWEFPPPTPSRLYLEKFRAREGKGPHCQGQQMPFVLFVFLSIKIFDHHRLAPRNKKYLHDCASTNSSTSLVSVSCRTIGCPMLGSSGCCNSWGLLGGCCPTGFRTSGGWAGPGAAASD